MMEMKREDKIPKNKEARRFVEVIKSYQLRKSMPTTPLQIL
ncbi:hypothetical protein KP78_02580 [Jeotgalibacillus soli]|uniref:Uncharacterized protein n=1 Tax=Jeotgalibacillus soli TaxID=889306 RepID=A0A0C2W778_9BACL|nr:hypothetical protein KP78_02580 [Jeotgalibacillus soli]